MAGDDVKAIREALERLEAKVDKNAETLGRVQSDLQSFRCSQEQICKASSKERTDHSETLYGRDGLKERVVRMEEIVKPVVDIHDRVRKVEQRMTLVWMGVLGFCGFAGKYIWEAIVSGKIPPHVP